MTVLQSIPANVEKVYVVDDCCPEKSGQFVLENNLNKRVEVVFHEENKGVGGAVKTGFDKALQSGFDIMVKLDGDGQMDAAFIPTLINDILNKEADYTKGNRFYDVRSLIVMPKLRLLGNSALSFINKVVNGYWHVMDPTNGFLAIHRSALSLLDHEKIDNRYFFESDMLFRLSIVKAVVKDVPMKAKYADEQSSLSIRKVLFEFPPKYVNRFCKRIFYNYFLRDFNAATLELIFGLPLLVFGFVFGISNWLHSINSHIVASTGTVMLAVLPIILGFQLLLSALNFDIANTPNDPLCKKLS